LWLFCDKVATSDINIELRVGSPLSNSGLRARKTVKEKPTKRERGDVCVCERERERVGKRGKESLRMFLNLKMKWRMT
jgi:hypothetical protein